MLLFNVNICYIGHVPPPKTSLRVPGSTFTTTREILKYNITQVQLANVKEFRPKYDFFSIFTFGKISLAIY